MMETRKHHTELTLDEMEQECENLARYFDDCALTGQGINSKDSVRFNYCFAKCFAAGRIQKDRWPARAY